MQQLELFEYRRDCLFDSKNQIAHYFDILKETEKTISYAEHIEPKSSFAIAGMSYEEYVDINKNDGFKFIGPTMINSFLMSSVFINGHEPKCYKYSKI